MSPSCSSRIGWVRVYSSSASSVVRARATKYKIETQNRKKKRKVSLFANHSCVANFPLSFTHRSFLVSFRRFSRGDAPPRPSIVSSSSSTRPLPLVSLPARLTLGLVARPPAFPVHGGAPEDFFAEFTFQRRDKSFVSETRELRNSRTRRYRGTTFLSEPPGWCSIPNWIKLSLLASLKTMITTTTSVDESKNPIHTNTLFDEHGVVVVPHVLCERPLSLSLSLSLKKKAVKKQSLFSP